MSPPITLQSTPSPSPALLARLRAHLPHSLPVLRRVQFASFAFPGGNDRTPNNTHVLYARHQHQHHHHHHHQVEEEGVEENGVEEGHFAAACVDLTRAPETQVWVYCSLEDGENNNNTTRGGVDGQADNGIAGGRGHSWSGRTRTREEEEALDLVVAVLRGIRGIQVAMASPSSGNGTLLKGWETEILVGSLHETIRQGLLARGVGMHKSANIPPEVDWEFCGKWLFRVEDLPLAGDCDVPEGMRWDRVRKEDVGVVQSRTSITRQEATLLMLPSMVLRLDDGTPVAWAFMGLDGTVMTLHVEEPYRQRGLAKALACKLMRERLSDYGDDGWGAADVYEGNHKSQALCRSIGGKNSWTLSWAMIDLCSVGDHM